MKQRRVLIIEDEHALAAALATVCRRLDCEPKLCHSAERGLAEIARGDFILLILDIGLPDMSGLKVLESAQQTAPQLPVLIITAHGSLDNAVAAKKLGASAYLVKPLDLSQLQTTIRQLLATAFSPLASLPASPIADDTSLLIGGAPAMQRVFVEIAHACVTDAVVLLTGPTGTGKTLLARVVHLNSARRAAPFVTLHCSAFPEQLLESELFGHEKNAFTGATTMRPGHIERAARGTLLLDEIADISPAMQAKLLRFVEEKTFVRVGGREDLHVDLRLMAATNKNLREEVQAGRFREDLYYRLHVLEIELPALTQRREDIAALSGYFLGSLAPQRRLQLAPQTLELLGRYPWPGNVRELRHALEHAVAVSSGNTIMPQHLPRDLRNHGLQSSAATTGLEQALEQWLTAKIDDGTAYNEIVAELEGVVLKRLLRHFNHKPTVLARAAKMNRATLLKKRKQLGLTSPI